MTTATQSTSHMIGVCQQFLKRTLALKMTLKARDETLTGVKNGAVRFVSASCWNRLIFFAEIEQMV